VKQLLGTESRYFKLFKYATMSRISRAESTESMDGIVDFGGLCSSISLLSMEYFSFSGV
jgi:hypothetical protein